MTKKFKICLLTVLGTIGAACALAGCKIGRPERAQVLADYNTHVTYYANGGYFNDSTTIMVSELWFKNKEGAANYNPQGVPFYDITEDSGDMTVEYKGYDLAGWFVPLTYTEGEHAGEIMYSYTPKGAEEAVNVYPVLKEDGTPVTDSTDDRPVFAREGVDEQILESQIRVVPSTEKMSSENFVPADQDGKGLIVCAVWRPALKIKYQLVCEEGKTYTDEKDKEYKNGDILKEVSFGKGDASTPSSTEPLELNGASFVHTYTEEVRSVTQASKDKEIATIDRPEAGEGDEVEDIVIYSWYLDGAGWNIVEDKKSAQSMINGLAGTGKYFVLSDVDLGGDPITLKTGTCQATVEGNGYTISNMKSTVTASGAVNYSLFGTIGENAVINNLKLDGITVDITGRYSSRITFYAICSDMKDGAKVNGLEVSNIKATIKLSISDSTAFESAKVPESVRPGIEDKTHWLFGGTDTDAVFLSKHDGIKISGENDVAIEDIT